MFAVVKTGGKQYKVSEGDVIEVEKIDAEVGATVELGPVVMTGDGQSIDIGAPVVENVKVTAKVIAQSRHAKILIMKHLRRKKSRKKQGHRQSFTRVEVLSVN